MSVVIRQGDCREVLRTLADESVHCVVTSPPYFGLRDYGVSGQIGLEPTPEAFVAEMVAVFREVRRVLRNDGTLWLNLGDSYAGNKTGNTNRGQKAGVNDNTIKRKVPHGLKPKDLIGIPWSVAVALRDDGWYLRQDIIWHKPNPMPESARDRCTRAHEYLFLLSKNESYYYDAGAVRELVSSNPATVARNRRAGSGLTDRATANSRNRRSVWTIAAQPTPEEHIAPFPPELPELCIKAGCPVGGTVLDPCSGAGTTGLVASRLGRDAILIELNPEYAEMAGWRIHNDAPLFVPVAAE